MAKRDNFYRRDPMRALNGMVGLSLEERGVYNTVIDLLYSTWRPVEDNRGFVAGWCGCAVQKLNPILDRLIAKGKIRRVQEAGAWVLTNDHFDDERAAVKGLGTGRRAPETEANVEEMSDRSPVEVGGCQGEVGEKSPGVRENLPLLDNEASETQGVTALEKRRIEKSRGDGETSPPPDDAKRGARIKPDWTPSIENRIFAASLGFSEPQIDRMAANFRDWWSAKSGKDAAKVDWSATWRNWVRSEADRHPPQRAVAKRVSFV